MSKEALMLTLVVLLDNRRYIVEHESAAYLEIYDESITAVEKALAEQPAQQDSTCSNALRAQGKAYPRTCKKCGLGPCVGLAQRTFDKKAENARELGLDYEPVCNKDPQGCWNVRCQLGKKCKNAPAQQEPVAWCSQCGHKCLPPAPVKQEPVQFKCTVIDDVYPNGIPLEQWTSPPQRKPLTDEEIYMNCPAWLSQDQCKTWVRQIEAAHGIKKENT